MKFLNSVLIMFLATVSIAALQTPLPIFSQPSFDSQNGIVEVFCEESVDASKISVTVVFKDEDHPCWLADIPYDIYRFFRYNN